MNKNFFVKSFFQFFYVLLIAYNRAICTFIVHALSSINQGMYNVLTYASCTILPFTCLESNTLIVLQWLALLEDQTINKRAVFSHCERLSIFSREYHMTSVIVNRTCFEYKYNYPRK
jgi:hypothetical protein